LKPELISQMRKIATEVNGVRDVHEIKVRRSGPLHLHALFMPRH